AQEEVVSLTGTAWHGRPSCSERWSRAECGTVKDIRGWKEAARRRSSALAPAWHGTRQVPSQRGDATSLNHLVGAGEHGGGEVEAKCLGSLEIEHRLVFGRRLNREFTRLLAPQNAIDVGSRPSPLINLIRPIGDQAAGRDEKAFPVNRRQLAP